MSKKSSDDKKSSSNSLNFSRLLGIITRFSGNSRRIFLMPALMLILEALTSLQIPNVIGYVVDYVTQYVLHNVPTKDPLPASILEHYLGFHSGIDPVWETVALTTLGIIFLTMLNSLFDSLTEIYLAQGGRKVGYNMRVFIYGHLQKLSLSFYGQSRTGDLLTRVTSDISAVEEFIVSNLADFLYAVVFLISAFVLMMQKSSGVWKKSGELGVFLIPLIAVLILPMMALIMNYFTGRIKAASKKLRSTEGELASAAQEMLSSIRVVQVYGQGGYEQSLFSGQSQKAMNAALEAAAYQARFKWAMSVLAAVVTAIIIWIGVGIIRANPGSIQPGILLTFIVWVDNMFKPAKKLISQWNAFGKLYASLERIGDLLDLTPEVRDKPDALTAPPFHGRIEFRNVVFSYPSVETSKKKGEGKARPTLNGLSFDVRPGQVVALVGHTGAGKSTVAQLLPRLYDPNEGQILIDGHDIRDYSLESLRAQMSMVLQESILFTG